jgi:hypothetical protein
MQLARVIPRIDPRVFCLISSAGIDSQEKSAKILVE